MERYNNESDFNRLYELMGKKSTRELQKELEHIAKKADALRSREFNGFKMNPRASRKLDIYAQERMVIETILSERNGTEQNQ